MLEKTKKLFQVDSTFQLFVIFVVFAITGSLSVVLGETVLLKFFGQDFINNDFFLAVKINSNLSDIPNSVDYCGYNFWSVQIFLENREKNINKNGLN